jgi:hypothetical protein
MKEEKDEEVDAWLADAGIIIEPQQSLQRLHNPKSTQTTTSTTSTSGRLQHRISQNKFGVGMSRSIQSMTEVSGNDSSFSTNTSTIILDSSKHFGSGRTLSGDSSALEKSMKRKRKFDDEDDVLLELSRKNSSFIRNINEKSNTSRSNIGSHMLMESQTKPLGDIKTKKKSKNSNSTLIQAPLVTDTFDEDEEGGRSSLVRGR